MLTSVDTAHRSCHESNCNTHKVESSPPEDVCSWSRFYDGGLLESQGRVSGEGTKWLPTGGNNTRCTHWPSPLARVHSRRRTPISNSIPSIRLRAFLPERTPIQPRTDGKGKAKLKEGKRQTSAWKSEEQLGLFAHQTPRCFSGDNGFVCGVVRPTVQRTRSEGGLPCKHCKESKTQSAILDLEQEIVGRKMSSKEKDKSRCCDDTIALLDSKQNTTVCLVRNDEMVCANANRSSGSNNNNNYHRENLTFLRDNSNALISVAGFGGVDERQQHQTWEMQPLGDDKVFVPLLLQDLEDFEAISDMDSKVSESSFCVDNSAKKTVE